MSVYKLMCSPQNDTSTNYTRPLLEIEKNFDLCRIYAWHHDNWTVCLPFIAVYLVVIFAGRYYMKSRPPFELRRPLLLWNVFLAVFSMITAWRMVTAQTYAVQNYGFHASVCGLNPLERRQAVGIWLFLFMLSKILEFGDTIFIVLRKSPLIFLHWYHHLITALSVWSTGVYAAPIQAYFATFNVTVHSIMYPYFAFRILNIHVPKPIRMSITSLQMVQMVAGMFVTAYVYFARRSDPTCDAPDGAILIAVTVYLSYLLLFLNFFVKSYVKRAQRGSKSVQNKKLE